MVGLYSRGRDTPVGPDVAPGNKFGVTRALPPPARSPDRARDLLARAGFSQKDGALRDGAGAPVEFTIVTNAANAARVHMATIVQEDLRELGMQVQVVPLENRALVDPGFQSHRY